MNAAEMTRMRWFWSVLVPLAFLHLFVFIQLPVNIFLESEGLNSAELPSVVLVLLLFASISLLVLTVLVTLLGWPGRKFVAPFLAAIAVSFWILDSFFPRSYPALDGALKELPTDPVHGWTQAIVFLLSLGLLFFFRKKLETPVLWFLAVLTLLNGFWAGQGLLQISRVAEQSKTGMETTEQRDPREFFTLSRRQNVLVFLMDTFQSEYLEEALEIRPELTEKLAGFIYFPDTVGVATSTFMSLPAIHSGRAYDPVKTMAAYFDESIRQQSMMTELAGQGYLATLLNPIRNVCPDGVHCLKRDTLLRSEWLAKQVIALYLLDISLMRSAPEAWKNDVFNQGKFLLGEKFGPAKLAGDALYVWDDARILKMFAQELEVSADGPTAKFIHLMNTHPPYVLDPDCEVEQDEAHDSGSRASAINQVVCALDSFAQVMNSLRDEGILDQTLVVLVGDHGSSSVYADRELVSRRFKATDDAPEDAARLVGSANPILLIKPLLATGPLRTDGRPADLTDLPATVCATTAVCSWPGGVDLLSAPALDQRERAFMAYRWEHRFWDLGYIPELDFYSISGPVTDWESWFAEAAVTRTEVANISFSDSDHHIEFGPGWGDPEISPQGNGMRWVIGNEAELLAELTEKSGALAYRIQLRIWVPDFTPAQTLQLELNGQALDKRETPPGNHQIVYRVPVERIVPGNNRLLLKFSQTAKPNDVDVRDLAVVFSGLSIQRIGSRISAPSEQGENVQ